MKMDILKAALNFMLIALMTGISFGEMVVHTTDGRSISVPVKRTQVQSIEFTEGRHAEERYSEPYGGRRQSYRVFTAVPPQGTGAFRHNPERNLSIDTTNWDRTPSSITGPAQWDIILESGQQCFLAGDPDGRTNWSVDNFILIEVFTDRETRRFVMGETEPVYYKGRRIDQIGPNTTVFAPGTLDLCAYMPKRVDFKLRISAFDYGNTGHVSNLFLVMQ